MYRQVRHRESRHTMIGKLTLVVVSACATCIPARAAQPQGVPEPPPASQEQYAPELEPHMSEELRSSVDKLVVIAGPSPASQEITGSYEEATPGLIGGMDAGSRAATIEKDVGGVPVYFPISVLTWPATIVGGISGATMREIQEFRDALTEDLAQAANQPLTNDGLATDVYFALQNVPGLDTKLFAPTTPVPNDTDAIMYVGVNELTIDVQGKEAILTTSAGVTLRRLSDGKDLYATVIRYQDRDTLSNWTKDENALWRNYANYARHYLGREISAELFGKVELRHELRPQESDTVSREKKKDEWHGVSRSTVPTLRWELTLLGGDTYGPWADKIDESNIYYDVEIYDSNQLVYAETQVQGSSHTLVYEAEPCKTYRWSVRPSYRVGSDIRFGEWMRSEPDTGSAPGEKGIFGREASEAPAYIQDFASLKIECGRR